MKIPTGLDITIHKFHHHGCQMWYVQKYSISIHDGMSDARAFTLHGLHEHVVIQHYASDADIKCWVFYLVCIFNVFLNCETQKYIDN